MNDLRSDLEAKSIAELQDIVDSNNIVLTDTETKGEIIELLLNIAVHDIPPNIDVKESP